MVPVGHISPRVEHGSKRENGKVDQVEQQHTYSAKAMPSLDPLFSNSLIWAQNIERLSRLFRCARMLRFFQIPTAEAKALLLSAAPAADSDFVYTTDSLIMLKTNLLDTG